MRNFKFFKKNDGTEMYQNNYNDILLHNTIDDLERQIQRLQIINNGLRGRIQHHASRVYPDIQHIRDEQRIDRYTHDQLFNQNTYYQHLRNQQVMRIAEKLLEENLIEHTVRQDEPNGDYVSRMEIKVQTIV